MSEILFIFHSEVDFCRFTISLTENSEDAAVGLTAPCLPVAHPSPLKAAAVVTSPLMTNVTATQSAPPGFSKTCNLMGLCSFSQG